MKRDSITTNPEETRQCDIHDSKSEIKNPRSNKKMDRGNSYGNQLIAVPISYQPTLATLRRTINSHCTKLITCYCQIMSTNIHFP